MIQHLFHPLVVSLLRQPLSIFLSLIPLILVRDFDATAQTLAWLTCLKTVSPFIGFIGVFACSAYSSRPLPLIGFLGLAARMPFFFFLFIRPDPSIILLAIVIYFSFMKMSLPYWIEAIHVLYQENRFTCWATIQSYSYLMGIFLGPVFGWLLDQDYLSFVSLSVLLASLSLVSLFIQLLVIREERLLTHFKKEKPFSFGIKTFINLFTITPHLMRFHAIFFIVGCGMLLFRMSIPLFLAPFKETLPYTKLWTISLWSKAVGGFLISLLGEKIVRHNPCPAIRFIVFLLLLEFFSLHFLVVAKGQSMLFLSLTFLLDGMVVSGSNLVWDFAPTLFCSGSTSRHYTQLNLLMNGLRGLVMPLFTKFLLSHNEYGSWMGLIFSLYCFGFMLSMLPS